ncbi:MAG: CHC2 zinc finger domain-containing protein [candidate division Zixibacteria bacterium]
MVNGVDLILNSVTISDILENHGIETSRIGRIPCPIHGGNNPSSFSHRDSIFNCFSFGASGGLIDLVCRLQNCRRKDAMDYLANMTGIELKREEVTSSGPLPKRKSRKRSAIIEGLKSDIYAINALRDSYGVRMRILGQLLKENQLLLAKHIAGMQYCEYELEYWGAEVIWLTHRVHSLQKGVK